MNDTRTIQAINKAISEAEKVTTENGFSPSKVSKARQIISQLKQDLRRLESKAIRA